ncbi:hypothetical protein [Leptospira stimsonii]|uniref:Uncharacterized protein n=1 Tax=Leptospira stimsonii TaxID=2202203 RepID=A0A396YUP6_9LEPT|nr:hypothetical protein [Leptospira stimsonii]RHX85096.1 hypothetical protein DLM75_21700 [Leptospira stimsonii]
MIVKLIPVEYRKIGAILGVFLIFYGSILSTPMIDSGKNASPFSASSETSETKEGEKEKTSELTLEDLDASDDSFVLRIPLGTVSYYDSSDIIFPQIYSKIENPPPEKTSLSSI